MAGDTAMPAGTRRVRVFPRGDLPVQAQWFPDPATNQWIAVIDSGVNLIVDGLERFGSIDVSADRLVIWTAGEREPDLTGRTLQDDRLPLEVYMEGNIVFRQGERVIYADRMYYDVMRRRGTVLDGEMLTPVPEYEGLLRLRAEVVRQAGEGRYFAHNGFITSSRMGRPGYRIQSRDIEFEDLQFPATDPFTGAPVIDPATGAPVIAHEQRATTSDNFLYLGPVPVLYWPVFSTDLKDPTFYIRSLRIREDSVYGTQAISTWNAYELFGIDERPEGTEWDLSLDYLGKRGLGHGTTYTYRRDHLFGVPGAVGGLADYWGIDDHGTDNLGAGRRRVPLEKGYRHRLFWQHRQQLPSNFQLALEVGWISDRNFLEEYFENEWDQLKDQSTGGELKRTVENRSWSVTADARLNPFFTDTEWLPRGDHFWLGQSVADVFTWYEHSSAGYARLRRADAPEDPGLAARWTSLPWERVDREGERLVTRQEIDWPFQLGPVKTVPYLLGELGHWGEDIDGDDLQRAYGQAGIRATLPLWTVNPAVESDLLNVHGLAHKVNFETEFFVADANRELTDLPLYDALDDNSIEAARRRLPFNTFGVPAGGPVPLQPMPFRFDPRSYALRTGLASWVTSPSAEIADDLTLLRFGAEQRWQTKRGRPGRRRIIDWITLDSHISLFPKERRDNFGTVAGLFDYDARWHVGDRLTLVSDGLF
ncbi:MAG: organic solvent tolerance protein OstA, partial [Pirellulales bacterium]